MCGSSNWPSWIRLADAEHTSRAALVREAIDRLLKSLKYEP